METSDENFVRGFQKYRGTNSKDSQDSRGFLGIPGDSKGFLKILGDSRGFSGIQQSEKHGVSKDSDGFRQISNLYFGDLAADCNIQLPVIVPLTDVRKNSRV